MNKVLVYVQHLLGIGHLHRTARITRAMAAHGMCVCVVSGGLPETGIDFGPVDLVQLTPIKTDSTFSGLYTADGKRFDTPAQIARRDALIETYRAFAPDAVVIETYPFGRRQMRFELLALLQLIHAKPTTRPVVACSIRDVIQPKSKTERVREIVELIQRYFDAVLVHGDPSFITLPQSFPAAANFFAKLHYTGYVASQAQTTGNPRGKNQILVSAGGGAVGERLYKTACKAAGTALGQDYLWHVLVGNNISDRAFADLRRMQGDNLVIERNRRDFSALLSHCAMSVSQGGYNTIMDILVSRTPAVVVPFEGQGEREQLFRAQRLREQNVVEIVREKALSVTTLLQAVELTAKKTRPDNVLLDIDGAHRSATLVQQFIAAKTMN